MAPDRYEVVKMYKKSTRRTVLATGVTLKQAQAKVDAYKNNNSSMVVYYKM